MGEDGTHCMSVPYGFSNFSIFKSFKIFSSISTSNADSSVFYLFFSSS